MAIDNTPPRLKLIMTIAAITVVTLVSLDFVFKSYYAMMTDEAQRLKLKPTAEADALHEAEKAALTSASIDNAMASLSKGTRPESITPTPSDDVAAMTGWSKLPKPAPVRQPTIGHAPMGVEHGDHAVLVDGGVAIGGDGGMPLSGAAGAPRAGDAGAARPTADAGAAPRGTAPHH